MNENSNFQETSAALFWRISAELGADGWQAVIDSAHAEVAAGARGTVTEVDEQFQVAVDVVLGRITMCDRQTGEQGSVVLAI